MSKNTIHFSSESLEPKRDFAAAAGVDPLAIDAFDHIHIHADSAKQSAFFLSHAFGFKPCAYRGPETGYRDSVSIVLKQGEVLIQISSPLHSTSPIADHVRRHGFSAKDIAFCVPDAESCYYEALKRGAVGVYSPTRLSDSNGHVIYSAIKTYGDTIHSFIDRKSYKGVFLPGFARFDTIYPQTPMSSEAGLKCIDHVVGNVELGKMNAWVKFYEEVLGFSQLMHFSDKEISTEYSL